MKSLGNQISIRKELFFQAVLFIIVFLFYSFDKSYPLIEFHEIVFFLNYVLASLVINYYLLPKFIYKKKYIVFIISFCLLIGLVILIEEAILEKIFFAETRGKKFSPLIYNLLDVLPPIIILSGPKFAWDAMVKQNELDELKIVVKESELQFLKSQINPHFLFNNMNNLYAHAIENSSKTPDIILAISDLLRYMLYDCKSKFVALDMEIEQLKNFINLNEMQIEGRGKVNFSYQNFGKNILIAPLLLMVFVENAFKHSTSSLIENIDIDIVLNVNESGKLLFICRNAYHIESNTENLSQGIGLANVKKRLELIYPGTHQLNITDDNHIFEVSLNLDLKIQ